MSTQQCVFVRLGLAASALAAPFVAGCLQIGGIAGRDQDEHHEVILTAARARQISLFGELPHQGDPLQNERPPVSMTQHTFSRVGADFDPHVSPDGTRLVFASTRHTLMPSLYMQRVDGVAVTQLTSDPASDIQPAFSPDGKYIAFASDRTGNWHIWIIPVDGGPPVQVTHDDADNIHPSWSPDRKQLVYCSRPEHGGAWELWITDVAGPSGKRFIGYGLFPRWSPSGDTILFQRARERGSRWFSIWTVDLVNGEPRYPTEVASSAAEALILPAWSPDGSRIVFSGSSNQLPEIRDRGLSANGETFDLWIVNADGTGRIRLTDGFGANLSPIFGPDGRMYFSSNRTGHENIWSLHPDTPPDDATSTGLERSGGFTAPTAGKDG